MYRYHAAFQQIANESFQQLQPKAHEALCDRPGWALREPSPGNTQADTQADTHADTQPDAQAGTQADTHACNRFLQPLLKSTAERSTTYMAFLPNAYIP